MISVVNLESVNFVVVRHYAMKEFLLNLPMVVMIFVLLTVAGIFEFLRVIEIFVVLSLELMYVVGLVLVECYQRAVY